MAGSITLRVRDQVFNVTVSDNGYFSTKFRGQDFSASKLDDLEAKISQGISQHRVKVKVPFMTMSTEYTGKERRMRFETVNITGKHGGTKNWLLHNITTGERSQDSSYGGYFSETYKVMDAETQADGLRLYRAMQAADAEFRAWKKDHAYNPRPDAERAMKEAEAQNEPNQT